jgi:outer membrane receptor protein involved in Fe transport
MIRAASAVDPPGDVAQQSASDKSGKEGKRDSSQDFRVAHVDQTAAGPQVEEKGEEKQFVLEEILVTGTYLHKVEPITPVTTITAAELADQGYTTLAQAIEQLPENFKAGAAQESNPVNGIGNGASNNFSYASGVNLRGLGSNATLVLLNGRRLAPTAYGGVVDISQIPVSMIERVEILPDGASALYGSDAVAGVVNIITKHDFKGLEVGGRLFSISGGKTPNYEGNALGGLSWNSGNLILAFDYQKENPLFARNRSFTTTLPDPTMLLPENKLSSYYASVHEAFTDRLTLAGDILFTKRDYFAQARLFPTDPAPYSAYGTAKQYSASLQLDYKLSSEWTASLIGQGSKEEDSATLVYLSDMPPDQFRDSPFGFRVASIEPRIDGALFDSPGGQVRLAVGGQFRREDYEDTHSSGVLGTPLTISHVIEQSRHISSAYGELLVPIVGPDNALSFVQRLRLSVSGRYDDYSDFGNTFNPKVALEWAPISALTLHGSYSRAFQAPTLYETSNSQLSGYVLPVPDPKSPSGSSLILETDGTNPNLQAEKARNWNVGFAYDLGAEQRVRLAASYFSVNFDNQINRIIFDGFFTNVLVQEAVLGSLVERNPPPSLVEQILNTPGRQIFNWAAGNFTPGPFTPSDIKAIANIGFQNAAVTSVRGVDLSTRFTGAQTRYGRFRSDLAGTYFTSYQRQVTPTANESSPLNTVYHPLRFRAKANMGWDYAGWSANLRLNYSNAYDNTNAVNPDCPGASNCRIASWTTTDLSLAYATPADASGPLAGVRVGLDVSNLFNRSPPVVSGPAGGRGVYPYDPVNANALLRTVALSVTKRWGGTASH